MDGIFLPLVIGAICGSVVTLVYAFWKKWNKK